MINQLDLTIIENRNVDKAQHLFEIRSILQEIPFH